MRWVFLRFLSGFLRKEKQEINREQKESEKEQILDQHQH